MRGFEPNDLINDPDCPLTRYDLAPFFYPSDEDLERVGVRGIYISNFIRWNAYEQVKFLIDELGFETAQRRERTFNLYSKLEDIHANGVHDYLKYLKFGYGRATDDAAMEIRFGRMTREEGIEMVRRHDHVRPSDLDIFLHEANMTEEEFMSYVDPLRDPAIWERDGDTWVAKDAVWRHAGDQGVDAVRLTPAEFDPIRPTPERTSAHCQQLHEQTEYITVAGVSFRTRPGRAIAEAVARVRIAAGEDI
jgi:hypothetical protein